MKRFKIRRLLCGIVSAIALTFAVVGHAQSYSGTISGAVTDATGAVIPNAKVTLANNVSGYTRTQTTDNAGHFQFINVPFNPYQLTVATSGFQTVNKRVDVDSTVAQTIPVALLTIREAFTAAP